jgi:hypothetical protein
MKSLVFAALMVASPVFAQAPSLSSDPTDHPLNVKMLWGERRRCGTFSASNNLIECRMPQSNDLSRSFAGLNQDSTLVVVIEIGQSS